MAEAIGLASGVLTLAGFALQASKTLCDTVRSFKSHADNVRDLLQELTALTEVLSALVQNVKDPKDVTLSALDVPLLQCGKVCKDFRQVLLKCVSDSGVGVTSFRGWARLRYMSGDIDEFRRQLASYKVTINVALNNANFQKSLVTLASLESHRDMVEAANENLQIRLDSIEQKLESILGPHTTSDSGVKAQDVSLLEEERLSTKRCIQICNELSDHISRLQFSAGPDISSESVYGRVTRTGLRECRKSLFNAASELEKYQESIMDRMIEKSKSSLTSEQDMAEVESLRAEWKATQRSIAVCFKASEDLVTNVSVINNYAVGDAEQYMVSTNGQVLHGTNEGLGHRSRQVGGHMSDATVVQLSHNMSRGDLRSPEGEEPPAQKVSPEEPRPDFGERYGRGVSLSSKTAASKNVVP